MQSGFTTPEELFRLAARLEAPLRWVGFKDQIPSHLVPGYGYIVNLESSYQGHGTHWVGFYISRYGRRAAYFDSFGAVMPLEVIRALQGNGYVVFRSRREIQNINSGYCGQYTLYFIKYMSAHETRRNFSRLIESFDELWSPLPRQNLGLLRERMEQALSEAH